MIILPKTSIILNTSRHNHMLSFVALYSCFVLYLCKFISVCS